MDNYDIVIIGSGVAGLTAGIYAARAKKKVLIIEEYNLGGTVAELAHIENYPGFATISGFELIQNMFMQASSYGVEFELNNIKSINFANNSLILSDKEITYSALIVACGLSHKKLNIAGEDTYKHKGLSYCAICDGNLYKNKNVCIVTDGLSAKNDIDYLLNLTDKVTVLDINNVYKNSKCKVYSSVLPLEVIGDSTKVNQIRFKVDDEIINIDTDGIFVDLGKFTNLDLFKELDTDGKYILSDENMKTNIDNVFVAGDIRQKSLRQIITACSDGAIAATQAVIYVSNKK